MDSDFKEQVRSAIDFPTLVAQSTQVRRSPNGSGSVPAFCPFHENTKTPAMAVYVDHAHCFSCGRTWDLYGWIMQRDKCDFPQALRLAADMAGLTMPDWTPERQEIEQKRQVRRDVLTAAMLYFQRELIRTRHDPDGAYQYARSRGFTIRTILRARLGYASGDLRELLSWLERAGLNQQEAVDAGLLGKAQGGGRIYARFRGRLVLPFIASGRCRFMTGRDLSGRSDLPKWLHLKVHDDDAHRPLYGSAHGSDPLVVVESPADQLTLQQLGRRSVAVLGTTLPPGSAKALAKHRPLWMMLDDDDAGRKGIDRLGQALGPRARVALLPAMDANAHLVALGPDDTKVAINETLTGAPTYVEHLAQRVQAAGIEDRDRVLDLFLSSVATMEARDLALMRSTLIDLSGIPTRTFNEVLKNHLAEQRADSTDFQPSLDGRYLIVNGMICRAGVNNPQPLADFSAHIERELKLDDGENVTTEYQVVGATSSGQRLPTARVPAAKFGEMTWLDEHWGVSAVVAAGKKMDVSTAIKLFSKGAVMEHIYTHTGWRKVDDQRVYLHCGGAVGYSGYNEIQVDLGNEMSRYQLPAKPEDPPGAFRTSLEILDVADPMVGLPLWAAMYQAPLGAIMPNRMVLWAYGPTNTFKSSLVLLAMCHFGPFQTEGDAVGWTSTGNAMELAAHIAKDAPLMLDDFAHQPNPYQQKKMQQSAERIIRSAGNESGRMRLNKLTKFQTTTRIRALIIATGETLPSVAPSAHARILPLRFTEATVNVDMLTIAQAQAERYPHAMAGYLIWVRDHWDQLAREMPESFQRHRAAIRERTRGQTARLSDAVCRNYTALEVALRYGQECGAVDPNRAQAILGDAWENLVHLSEMQDLEVKAEDPVKRFCSILQELLEGGRAWLCPVDPPEEPVQPYGTEKIGWIDGDHYWLLPDICFGMIQQQSQRTGYPFTFSLRETQERLHEADILVKDDPNRWKCRLQRKLLPERPWCIKLVKEKIFSQL